VDVKTNWDVNLDKSTNEEALIVYIRAESSIRDCDFCQKRFEILFKALKDREISFPLSKPIYAYQSFNKRLI
jgi:hypothetical protein